MCSLLQPQSEWRQHAAIGMVAEAVGSSCATRTRARTTRSAASPSTAKTRKLKNGCSKNLYRSECDEMMQRVESMGRSYLCVLASRGCRDRASQPIHVLLEVSVVLRSRRPLSADGRQRKEAGSTVETQ